MDINDLITGVLGAPTPTGPGILSGLASPSTNLGLALLANSGPSRLPTTFGQVLGQSAIQAQDAQANAIARRAQLAQALLGLQFQQGKLNAFQGAFGGPGAASPQGAGEGAPGAIGAPATSTASEPSPQVQQANTNSPLARWLNPPSPGDIGPAVNPQSTEALALYAPDTLKALGEAHQQQLQLAQQRYAPQIAKLASVVQSDSPARLVKADPTLSALWPQYARAQGLDPDKDMTDANLRQVFGQAANQYRAALSEATVAPPMQQLTVTLPDGRTAQVDRSNGKMTILPASALEKVVVNGKPVLMPTAKAAGMTPYNQFNMATDDDIESTAKAIANYQLAPPTGSRMSSGNWPAIMRMVRQLNPDYDATQYASKNKARMAFATGKQGDTVRSLSVATSHLDQLSQAADALKNGNIQVVNRLVNGFAAQTGNANVTNFDAMKEIVGDEVVKAVVGTSGAEGDRQAIKNAFSNAKSPAQLQGVIEKYEGLMGGQLNGLRRQYEHSTGLKDFESMVSPEAQSKLETAAGPSSGKAPPAAIAYLRAHPEAADQFKAKYGYLP